MELIKKIIASILILAGFAFMGVMVCAAVLLLSPGTKIFGYAYTSSSEVDHLTPIVIASGTDLNTVNITSSSFDIRLIHHKQTDSNFDTFLVNYSNKLQGFYNSEIGVAEISQEFDNTGSTVTITVEEPTGFLFKNESYVEIVLPYDMDLDQVDINTNSGNVSFGDTAFFTCKRLSIKNTSPLAGIEIGTCNIVNQLTIENVAGNVVLNSSITAKVDITTNYGSFTFKKVGTEYYPFTITGVNPSVTIEEMAGKFTYNAKMGLVNVTTFDAEALFTTESASINVENALGDFSVSGSVSNLNIESLGTLLSMESGTNVANLYAGNGNIHIKHQYFDTRIISDHGNVVIENNYNALSVETNYGTVSVNSADNVYYNDELLEDFYVGDIVILSNSGTVNATNIQSELSVTSTGNAVINVEFTKVLGNSIIYGGTQKLTVTAPNEKYKLITQSVTGTVTLDIGSVTYPVSPLPVNMTVETTTIGAATYHQITSYINFGNDPGNASYTANTITIRSTSGTIQVAE